MSLLVISQTLGLFAKKLTANDKHSPCNSWNLQQPFQMQLPTKKSVFWIVFYIMKSASNFEYFENKDDHHSLCTSQIMGSKRNGEKKL